MLVIKAIYNANKKLLLKMTKVSTNQKKIVYFLVLKEIILINE